MIKKLPFFILALLTAPCFAAYDGFSFGLQAGYARTDNPDSENNPVGKGPFGRACLGYQWSKNWAAELGYTFVDYVNNETENVVSNVISGIFNSPSRNRFKEAENITDLAIKAMLPFNCKTRLYGKAGMAYAAIDMHDNNKTRFCPIYGAGFAYDITSCVPVEIFWTQIYENNLGNVNLFGLGLSYHFG